MTQTRSTTRAPSAVFRSVAAVGALIAAGVVCLGCGRLRECESKESRSEKDACYVREAKAQLRPQLCERVLGPDARNGCFEQSGRDLRRVDLCLRIDQKDMRARCVSRVAATLTSIQTCNELLGTWRDDCVAEVATESRDADACKTIQVLAKRRDCVRNIAERERRPEICGRIEQADARDQCLESVSLYGGDTTGERFCEQMSSPEIKNRCYSRAARNNPTLCEKVGEAESDPARTSCYHTVDWKNLNCGQVPNPTGQMECWRAAARRYSEPKFCERIAAQPERDQCLTSMALQTSKGAACALIANPTLRLDCARRVSFRGVDSSVCQLLPTGHEREKCVLESRNSGR